MPLSLGGRRGQDLGNGGYSGSSLLLHLLGYMPFPGQRADREFALDHPYINQCSFFSDQDRVC